MPHKYRILHFGDIHYDIRDNWDSGNILSEFRDKLPEIREEFGTFDFAFCTGDITKSGTEEQFNYMSKWFHDSFFTETGLGLSKDAMFVVPGNHDVSWGDITHAARLIQDSIKRTNTQQEIACHYNDHSTLEIMTKRMNNYCEFVREVTTQDPHLDGSWCTSFGTGRYKVEIEGLSSSWLSGPDGEDDGRLVVGKPQLHRLRQNRVNGPFRIALMHHPLSSLLECDRAELENEARNKYDIVLRGHLHAPSTTVVVSQTNQYIEVSTGSLYSGGRYQNSFNVIEISFEERLLRVYPFIWHDGNWKSDTLTYGPSGHIDVPLPFSLGETSSHPDQEESLPPLPDDSGEENRLTFPKSIGDPIVVLQEQSKSYPTEASASSAYSACCPRKSAIAKTTSDLSIWHELCDSLSSNIRAHNPSCVFVPPGFDASDILPSLIAVCDEHVREQIFRVRSSSLTTSDDLQQAIEASLGVTVTDFARYCDRHGGGLLIIEGWDSATEIRNDEHVDPDDPSHLLSMICEFCPELAVVAFTSNPATPYTHQLEPLDAASVGDFVRRHEWCDFDFNDFAQIEAVADVTGGIPQQIVHFLELRRVSDFDSALSELRRPSTSRGNVDLTPRQIAVLDVPAESNPGLRNMIDVLAVLERGEPLREIRNMLHTEQPTAADALLLSSLQLATTQAVESPENSKRDPVSVIRLRRHAWEYVNQNMTKERKADVIAIVAAAYFGIQWETDAIKLRRRSQRTGPHSHDVSRVFSNEVYIIEQLFDAAANNRDALVRVSSLALKYCEKLRRQDRFGDAYFASRELLSRVEHACAQTGDDDVEEEFRLTTARSSRMAGEASRAIELLSHIEANPSGAAFKTRRHDALAALMLSYESEDRPDDAKRMAKVLMDEAPSNSWHHVQAAAVHAAFEGDEKEVFRKLTSLEKKARRNNHNVVAENILISLAYRAASPSAAKAYLHKVRSGDERMYNYVRATAKYASLTISHDGVEALSARDIASIEAGYTYMFSQRMVSLLTTFHDIIWKILAHRGDYDAQIKLLKHSSFVWRLCGDRQTEQKYLKQVEGRCSAIHSSIDGPFRKALSYIIARLRGTGIMS